MAGRSQIPFVVVDLDGDALEDATVAITHRVGGAAATVYTSETGGITLGSGTPQVLSQKNGRIPGWVPEGSYTVVITHASLPGSPWTRQLDIAKGAGVGNLEDGVVVAAKVADNSITTSKFADGAITTSKITNASVGETKIADNAASTRAIAANAITAPELGPDSIDSRTIATDAVTTTKIGLDAVGSSELVSASVIAGKYAANAVTGAKIQDGAVRTAHVADDAVTNGKFALASLTNRAFNPANTLPVGTIMPFPFWVDRTADGWLACAGQALDANIWAQLFAVCGYTYGGSGGFFNAPDLRGRVPYATNPNTAGGIGGRGAVEGGAGGVALNQRGHRHTHYINGTVTLIQGGDHHHGVNASSDVKVGGGAYDYGSDALGGMRNFYGNYVGWMNTGGDHSHTLGGFWGDTNGGPNGPSMIVMGYYIRAGIQSPIP